MTTFKQTEQECKSRIGASFRVVLPPEVREALGVREGETLTFRVSQGRVELESKQQWLARLHGQYEAAAKGLADELSTERRAEAARE